MCDGEKFRILNGRDFVIDSVSIFWGVVRILLVSVFLFVTWRFFKKNGVLYDLV